MHILALCGSLRKASKNMGMLRYARDHAPEGVSIEIADVSQLPFYNEDTPDPTPAVQTLFDQLLRADGLLIACNEYNYSLAPALKNALDWASRDPANRYFNEKPVALLGAAGGMGSSRAQYHLRQVLVFLNMHPLNKPEVFANAYAGGFNDAGDLIDPKIQANVDKLIAALVAFEKRLSQ